MTSKTHASLGLLVGLALLHNNPSLDVYTTISGACIGSLLPDLDTKKSDPSQIFPPISLIVDKLTKHRGWTHTMFPLILIIMYYYYQSYTCYILGLGSLSHAAIDAITLRVGVTCNSVGERVLYYLFWCFNVILIAGFFLGANEVSEIKELMLR